MALLETFYPSTLDYRGWYFGPQSSHKDGLNKLVTSDDHLPKAKGVWIKLSNKSKFRKATSMSRFNRTFIPGRRMEIRGTQQGQPLSLISSPGGYYYSLCALTGISLKSSIGAVTDCSGTTNIPNSMRNEAVTKALLKISDQKAGIGEDLATFRQTLDLIRNPSMALVNSLRYARKHPKFQDYIFMGAKELLRRHNLGDVLASQYLAYVYGWVPLLKDIHGVMSFLKDEGSNKAFLLYGKGSSAQQGTTSVVRQNDPSGSCWTDIGPLTEEAKVRCNIWARIDPQHTGLRALNQLGLLNPLSLMWELTPWSFVVDWMLPIGSVLQALTAPAGLLFVDGSLSVRATSVGPWSHHNYSVDDNTITSSINGDGILKFDMYKRETLGTWPMPGLWINYSPFAGEHNDRPLKAVALAVLALNKLK